MNIGFISVRLGGLDGVSLETDKWVQVLKRRGHKCFFCTGEILDKPGYSFVTERSYPELKKAKIIPRMRLKYKENIRIRRLKYSDKEDLLTKLVENEVKAIKKDIIKWIEKKKIDLLIVENASCNPLHISLGIAIARIIRGEEIPAILHHHDFAWERRGIGKENRIYENYIKYYFPFDHRKVKHVVINKVAKVELKKRYKIKSIVIPNVFNYKERFKVKDNFNKNFRKDFDLEEKDIIALAPVRVVPRKDLKTAIKIVAELDKRLDQHVVLVITGFTTDVGKPHETSLRRSAEKLNCDVRFIGDRIKARRYKTDGKRYYSLWDVYPYADLIVYPSIWEGWGNAFGEALAFKKLIVVRRYLIYRTDIEPLGFKTISFNKYGKNVINRIIHHLNHSEEIKQMAENNFEIAKRKLNYDLLDRKLRRTIKKLNEQII